MKNITFSNRFIGVAIAALASFAPAAAFAGAIVVTTPSGESTIVYTNGVASHVTSDFSAQIDAVFAGPGEHIVVTPNGTNISESSGETATITVVNK